MRLLARLSIGLLAVTVVACAGTPAVSPTPDGSPSPVPSPAESPSPSPAPTDAPTASPEPTDAGSSPSPEPTAASPTTSPDPTAAPTTPPAGTGWSGPDRISERSYYEPSMVVDIGVTELVYAAAGLNGGIFFVTNDEGNVAGRWTRERVSNPPRRNVDEQPSLALDESDGDMYIAFTRMYDSELGRFPEGIHLAHRPYGGEWSTPTLLVGGGAHSPSLKASGGRIHLAFVASSPTDVIEDDPHHPVMYGTDAGGSFAAVEVFRNGAEPRLELGSDGRPHILFGSPYWAEIGVRYAIGSASGGSFSVEQLPGTTGGERRPSLALDASDRPHAVWNLWADGAPRPHVYYSRRAGSGWSTPERVLDDVLATGVVVDYQGTVHIVGGGETGVWYATGSRGSFSTARLSRQSALWLDLTVPVGEHGGPQVHLLFVSGTDERGTGLWYGVGRVD